MPVVALRHQHRHFKTLIVLVLAMTGGTILLFWIAQLAPVTPLRASINPWSRISVRAQDDLGPRGFYHYRIDASGRLFQSRAWNNGESNPANPGTIHLLLTCPGSERRVTSAQAATLSHILSRLRSEHSISSGNVHVEATQGVVDRGALPSSRLRRT